MADQILTLINSTQITLTAGDYALDWGALDQQQVTLNVINIIANSVGGTVNITLPDARSPRSMGVTFNVIPVPQSPAEAVTVSVVPDNILNGAGAVSVTVGNGKSQAFQCFGFSNWTLGNGVVAP